MAAPRERTIAATTHLPALMVMGTWQDSSVIFGYDAYERMLFNGRGHGRQYGHWHDFERGLYIAPEAGVSLTVEAVSPADKSNSASAALAVLAPCATE